MSLQDKKRQYFNQQGYSGSIQEQDKQWREANSISLWGTMSLLAFLIGAGYTAGGLIKRLYNYFNDGLSGSGAWLLSGGVWADSGEWSDSDVWEDS